jgi:hypothetical protein
LTKLRGEVPFPPAGNGAFFMFTLSEGVSLEEKFGEDFFEKIELAVRNGVLGTMTHCVKVGLKRRNADDKAVRIVDDIDDIGFHIQEAGKAILDAVSLLVANESYDDLLVKIAKAQKEQITAAAKEAKEAADAAGAPFTEEALVNAILRSGFAPG